MNSLSVKVNRLLSNNYYRSGLFSWGAIALSTGLVLTALSASAFPSRMPLSDAAQRGMLTASAVGFASRLGRKSRLIAADVEETRLVELRDQLKLKTTSAINPHKTVLEMAMQQKGIEQRIMNAFNQTGLVRLSSCVESNINSPVFRRYLCEVYSVSGRASQLYSEETLHQIRRDMQLMPNTRSGQERGIIVHPVVDGTNKFAVDIDKHEDERGDTPKLHNILSMPPAGLKILIGHDYEKSRDVMQDVEADRLTSIVISGASGSGKSSWLITFVNWLIANYPPSRVNLILSDLKNNDGDKSPTFGLGYDELPHLKLPTITSDEATLIALEGVWEEMRDRNRKLAKLNSLPPDDKHHIKEASVIALHEKFPDVMPHLFFIIDEAQTLRVGSYEDSKDKTLWQYMAEEVMRLGRSAGIHMVLGYQEISWNEISRLMINNCSLRIAMRAGDQFTAPMTFGFSPSSKDSRVEELGMKGISLAGKQDMLANVDGVFKRLQGYQSHNRPKDYPIKGDKEPTIYIGDMPEQQGWFKSVRALEQQYGYKSKLQLSGLLEGEKTKPVLREALTQAEDERILESIFKQYLKYCAAKNPDEKSDQINTTDFLNASADDETGFRALEISIPKDERPAKLDQALRTHARPLYLNIAIQALSAGYPADSAEHIIDDLWGTKNTSHASRLNNKRTRQKEQERLEWAQGILDEAARSHQQGGQ